MAYCSTANPTVLHDPCSHVESSADCQIWVQEGILLPVRIAETLSGEWVHLPLQHQAGFICWDHLGLFHKAISLQGPQALVPFSPFVVPIGKNSLMS